MPQPNVPRQNDDPPPVRNADVSDVGASAPNRELLEQVVRRTLAEQEANELPPALVSALHNVAIRQRAEAKPWETVVVELVDQMLANWFSPKLLGMEARQKMAAEIADVLISDPVANARLRRFWDRISEEVL